MKQTDVSYQKLTKEWNKHIRKRVGLKKLYNKETSIIMKERKNNYENNQRKSKRIL